MTTAKMVKWILVLVGLALVVFVAVQNSDPVTIRVLFWNATIDRLILFPALFVAGLILGFALGWGWERKRARPRPPR